MYEPAVVESALHITVVGKSESKVESRRHRSVGRSLTESVAYRGLKERQCHRPRLAIPTAHVAYHHEEAAGVLCRLRPEIVLLFGQCRQNLYLSVAAREYLYAVFVYDTGFYGERLPAQGGGRNFYLFIFQVMAYDYAGIVFQCDSAFEFL